MSSTATAAPFEVAGQWLSYFSRPSIGSYFDDNGIMQIAPANVPRVDWSSGTGELLLESAATNYFLNGDLGGATVGTVGAGGILPSGFGESAGTGLTVEVLDTPTIEGVSCVRIRISGTLSANIKEVTNGASSYTIPTDGSAIVDSLYVRLVAGSTQNLALAMWAAETGSISQTAQTDLTQALGAVQARLTRVSNGLAAIQNPSGAYAKQFGILLTKAVGAATDAPVDITFDIGGIQTEAGTMPTSYIPTSGTSLTRAADVALFVPAPALPTPSRGVTGRTADQVLDELLALSPPGEAMPHTPDSMWANMLRPFSEEISRIEALFGAFWDEIDPGTSVYLLPDYERVLGPDPYGRDQADLPVAARQKLAYSRWVNKYGVRPVDFIQLAAALGVTISIREYKLSECGRLQCGQSTVNHPVEFDWLVTLPTPVTTQGQCGVLQCGDATSYFQPSLVQGAIEARAPTHTVPIFSYTG